MVATSRWVRYPVSGSSYISSALEGERGFSRGTDNVGDTFTIPGSSTNQIKVNIDGAGAQEITLTSGTDLDARFVARDIQRKVQAFDSVNDGYKFATCEFTNYLSADGESHFVIRSGTTGTSSSVLITAGTSSALTILGLSSLSTGPVAGAGSDNHTGTASTTNDSNYTGTITASGTYGGMLDEEYYIVVSDALLSSVSVGGGNTYAGTATITGDWNHDTACSYTVTIDTSGGNEVMNAGTTNVPTFTVNDTGGLNDDIATAQELLYSDYYYYVGTKGQRIRFTDAQFGNGDTFTITCTPSSGGGGSVGAAEFVYTSSRGENATAAVTTSTSPVSVGQKGLTIQWTDSNTLTAKDAWRVLCRAPTPEAYGVTSMVYGNVTVTTNSPVKVHQFELLSGAVVLTNVKFSLQSDGTFSHHDQGDGDTEFHFGTAGAGQRGDGSGPTAGTGLEWKTDVAAADIAADKTGGSTGSPTFLYSSVDDLAVVSDADSAEAIGVAPGEMVSDFIFTSIGLGANETGANSSINYRAYFDFS